MLKDGLKLEKVDRYLRLYDFYYTWVTLFNVLFSRILFTGKVMALSCSILGTYYVLSHSQNQSHIFTLFFGAASIQGIAFYTVSCKQLFETPENFDAYKRNCSLLTLQVKVRQGRNGFRPVSVLDRKIRLYKIKSMVRTGFKDGGFRILESVNTLLFMDFYLSNVINLLLM